MSKARPTNDAPFIFDVSPDTFLGDNDTALPLICVARILRIMDDNSAKTLYERYVASFKSAIRQLVSEHKIRVMHGSVIPDGPGEREEVLAKLKQEARAKSLKFKQYMQDFAAEKRRQAGQ